MTSCCRCPKPALYVGRLHLATDLPKLVVPLQAECGFCEDCAQALRAWCQVEAEDTKGAPA